MTVHVSLEGGGGGGSNVTNFFSLCRSTRLVELMLMAVTIFIFVWLGQKLNAKNSDMGSYPTAPYKYTFKTLYRGKLEGPTSTHLKHYTAENSKALGNYYGRRRRPKSFWVTYDYALLRGSFWHYSCLALLRGGFRDLPV